MTKEEIANRIVTDPNTIVGKPVVKGTRLTVELILRQLANGKTIEELIKNYPHLTKEDIFACIGYATKLIETEKVYTL